MAGTDAQAAAELRVAKQALRKAVLAQRDALSLQQRERLSESITARLLDAAAFKNARSVLAYLSFGAEFQTDAFVDTLRSRGVALALPRVNRETRQLDVYRVENLTADIIAGVWGIREPDPARCAPAQLQEIEAVLVPGVAFTPLCNRLGYGGGFYDRLLRRWPGAVPSVAAAFDLQIVDSLPVGPEDRPVGAVVTESASYSKSAPTA